MDKTKKGCQCVKPTITTGPYPLGINKDYHYFKTGSWWVYKNNLTNEKDSIVTIQCDTASITFTEEYPGEFYKTTFTQLFIRQKSFSYNYTLQYLCNKISPEKYHFFLDKTTYFQSNTKYSTPWAYPFQPEAYFKELIPNITIQGKTYNEVAVFQIWNDESVQLPTLPYYFLSDAPTKYYWAKEIGLIMIEQGLFRPDLQQSFTHKWELTNYNLIK